MRKGIAAVAAAGSMFALAAAGASALTVTSTNGTLYVTNSGRASVQQYQCADNWSLTYTVDSADGAISKVEAIDTTNDGTTGKEVPAQCANGATFQFATETAKTAEIVGNKYTFTYSTPFVLTPNTPFTPTLVVGHNG